MGAFCTKKSVDDVIPDHTAGGLAGHTRLERSNSKKVDLDIDPHKLSRSESKKLQERKNIQAKLDAVQEARVRQQQLGVQRLHERTQSQKLVKKQQKDKSASTDAPTPSRGQSGEAAAPINGEAMSGDGWGKAGEGKAGEDVEKAGEKDGASDAWKKATGDGFPLVFKVS